MSTPPITVTSTIQSIWNDVGESVIVAALATNPATTWISTLMTSPWTKWFMVPIVNNAVDGLIAVAVIEVKILLINFMSDSAKSKWAAEIKILQQVAAAGKTLTAEQQAAYDAALQQLVENHSGVVAS